MAEMEKDKMQEKSSSWKKWTAIAAVALAGIFGGNVQEAEAGSAYGKAPQPPKIHKQAMVRDTVISKEIAAMKFGKHEVTITKKIYKAPPKTIQKAMKKKEIQKIANVKKSSKLSHSIKQNKKVLKKPTLKSHNHKGPKPQRSERDEFNDRIRVKPQTITKIVIKSEPRDTTKDRKIATPANNQHLTQSENARLTELTQRHLDLRAQLRDAKERNDTHSQMLIAIELQKVTTEKSELFSSARTRKSEQEQKTGEKLQISRQVKPMEPGKNLEDKLAELKLKQLQAARHRDTETVQELREEINRINAQIIQQAEASRQQGGDER